MMMVGNLLILLKDVFGNKPIEEVQEKNDRIARMKRKVKRRKRNG